jgi:hypothetical protein
MRSSSCLIEFANADGDSIRCGQSAVGDCADCGLSICSDCRAECCGESFCDYCYDYHLTTFLTAKTCPDRRTESPAGPECRITTFIAQTVEAEPTQNPDLSGICPPGANALPCY